MGASQASDASPILAFRTRIELKGFEEAKRWDARSASQGFSGGIAFGFGMAVASLKPILKYDIIEKMEAAKQENISLFSTPYEALDRCYGICYTSV